MASIREVDQAAVSRLAVASVREFLGGPHPDGDGWRFDFGEHLESNWGAVYGGALAAGMLSIARLVSPERSPRSLHIQIVRSVPRGVAYATAEVRHAGRTVGTVQIDLFDHRRKLAAVALVTMVTPGAVAGELHNSTARSPFRVTTFPIPSDNIGFGADAPIVGALALNSQRAGVPVMLTAANARANVDNSPNSVGECTLPWDDLEVTGPEASCLAADANVAAPVLCSSVPLDAIGPNADLTLRFTTAPAARVLETTAVMQSIQHGTATICLEIHAGDQHLAAGLATALFLPPREV